MQKNRILFILIAFSSFYLFMSLSPHRNLTKTPLDINKYVITQIKRKVQPFFYRAYSRRIKSKAEKKSSPQAKKQQCTNIKSHLFQLTHANSNISSIQKLKGQQKESNQNFDRNWMLRSSQNQETSNYYKLKRKVEKLISEEKQGFEQDNEVSEILSSYQPIVNMNKKIGHRRVISSFTKPFDFCKMVEEVKNNQSILKRAELQNYLGIDKENQAKQEKQVLSILKKEKLSKLAGKQEKKKKIRSSILCRANQQKIDEIDLQFEQGLVEEIYTTKRIKFRKKIKEMKSRKSILEMNHFFPLH